MVKEEEKEKNHIGTDRISPEYLCRFNFESISSFYAVPVATLFSLLLRQQKECFNPAKNGTIFFLSPFPWLVGWLLSFTASW